MKKLLVFLSIVILAFMCTGCKKTPEGISVTSENGLRNIQVGETLQLTAAVFPEKANQGVNWASNDSAIATVSDTGLVTAVNPGTVDIVVSSKEKSDVKQSFTIIVEAGSVVEAIPNKVEITASATTCKAGETITLTAIVEPSDASQSVVWETSDVEVATVSRGEVTGLKEGTVTITCYAKGYPDVKDTIDLTIEKGDGPIQTKNWSEMAYSTHEEYMTAEADTPLKVKGVVTHILPAKDNLVSYLIQNGTEGYYVYNQDIINFPVELGKTYEVGGFKKYYRGLNELVNVEHFIELDENITYTVNSLENVNTTDLASVDPYHCSFVTGSAVITELEVNTTKAYSFYATIGTYSTQFRVDPAYMTAEEFAAINEKLSTAVIGGEFEFTGIMSAFGYGAASPQIQIVKASDLEVASMSDEELLEAAVDSLTISSSVSMYKETISLPTIVEGFAEITVTWSSNNAAINVETGAVAHTEENITVTLVATLSLNGKQLTKEFKVIVFALDTTEYEVVASLDLEDAEQGGQYGTSNTKPGYAEGVVQLGTPLSNWMLRNALIAGSSSDKYDGVFSIRAQGNADAAKTARVEIQQDGEYNVVEFDVAIYGNDNTGIQIRIEYSTDSGATWTASPEIITVDSRELETYRVKLPEGIKRVAIVVVEGTGKRVNLDNIKLMK